MGEKMRGVVAQLVTTTSQGTRLDSKIVFRPYCAWYMKDLRDDLAETEYKDFGGFIEEFGDDIAQRVIDGEIIEVDRVPYPQMEFRGCDPDKVGKFVRVSHVTKRGTTEDLMREDIAKQLGYIREE
ncbi:hypothetical protein ES705_33954 [subsurface metagenome]